MDYARGRHDAVPIPDLSRSRGSDDLDMVAALRAQLEAMLPVQADAANAAIEDRLESEMAEIFLSISEEMGHTGIVDEDAGAEAADAATFELLDELDRLWMRGDA